LSGDYELMSSEKDSDNYYNGQDKNESDLLDNDNFNDSPF